MHLSDEWDQESSPVGDLGGLPRPLGDDLAELLEPLYLHGPFDVRLARAIENLADLQRLHADELGDSGRAAVQEAFDTLSFLFCTHALERTTQAG